VRVLFTQFTIRRLMAAVGAVGLALGFSAMSLRWHLNPCVVVIVQNNTSKPLNDVRIRYNYGERKARVIKPGCEAYWEIRCSDESDVILEYTNSLGIQIIKNDNGYIEHNYRGELDIQVNDDGIRVINKIY
jgi:hypothetical protein